MLPVSLDCQFLITPSSCVPYVASFSWLSVSDYPFVLCTLCCQFLSIVSFVLPLRLVYPMLLVSLDCQFLITHSSCVPYVASFSGLSVLITPSSCCQFLWIVCFRLPLRLVYPMLPVSLDCRFLITPSSCVPYVASFSGLSVFDYPFVLCNLCNQFLWIVSFWLPLRLVDPMLPVSLDCQFCITPSSCVPYVASFSGLSVFDYPFVLCTLCYQFLWIVSFWLPLRLVYPMLPVSLDCPFLITPSSCVPYVTSFSGLSVSDYPFVLWTICCQFLSIDSLYYPFVLCTPFCQFLWIVSFDYPFVLLPVSLHCPFFITPSSCVPYVTSFSGLSVSDYPFVLCTLCCQFLSIVSFVLPLRLVYPMLPVSLDCPFLITPSSCVTYATSFSGLSVSDYPFVLWTLCCQFLSIVSFVLPLRLVYPMLPVSLDCPFLITPSSCVPYVASFSGLSVFDYPFVLCTLCCQFLWIVRFWLPLRLVYPMLSVSLDFPFLITPSSCVPYVASFSGLSVFDYPFVLCTLCYQFLWIVSFWLPLRLVYPMLPVSLDCPFLITPSSCVPYVTSFSGLSVSDYPFVLWTICCQFLSIVSLYYPLVLCTPFCQFLWIVSFDYPFVFLPVSLDCLFLITPSSCVLYVTRVSGLSVSDYPFVLCTLCCQFLWIVCFWLPLRLVYPILPVSLDCPFMITPSSCVPYVASFSGLSIFDYPFVLCTLCCQFLWIVHFWLPIRLVYPMLPVSLDCPFLITPSSCVPYVASFSGLSVFDYPFVLCTLCCQFLWIVRF